MMLLSSRRCGAGARPFEHKRLAYTSVGTHPHVDRDCSCLFECICKLHGIQYCMDSSSCLNGEKDSVKRGMNCRFDAIPLIIFEFRPLCNYCALTSSACSELFHHLCSLAVAKILRFNRDFTSWIHRKMTCWQPSDEKELCMFCIPVPLEIITAATFQKLLHDESNLYHPNAFTLCALPLQDGENKIDPLCPNSAEPEMGKANQPVQAVYTKKLCQVRRGVFLPVQWNAGSMHHDRPL